MLIEPLVLDEEPLDPAEFGEPDTVHEPGGRVRVAAGRWQQLGRLLDRLVAEKARLADSLFDGVAARRPWDGSLVSRFARIQRAQFRVEERLGIRPGKED